jgi:hypothetical protein
MARLSVLALSAVNKGGSFCVETVQTMGLLIDKGIVLRNKLPPDFRRNDRRGIGTRHAGKELVGTRATLEELTLKWERKSLGVQRRAQKIYSTHRSAFRGGTRVLLPAGIARCSTAFMAQIRYRRLISRSPAPHFDTAQHRV